MRPKIVRFMEADSDSDESVGDVMKELRESMDALAAGSKIIDRQVRRLFVRAKKETTDWLNEPLRAKPAVAAWLTQRGLSSPISIEQFIDACYSAAKTMDLETRILTFSREDAAILWEGRRRISVFELTSMLPALFD